MTIQIQKFAQAVAPMVPSSVRAMEGVAQVRFALMKAVVWPMSVKIQGAAGMKSVVLKPNVLMVAACRKIVTSVNLVVVGMANIATMVVVWVAPNAQRVPSSSAMHVGIPAVVLVGP